MNIKIKYIIFTLSVIAFISLCIFLEINDRPSRNVNIEYVARSPYKMIETDSIKSFIDKVIASTPADSLSISLLKAEETINQNPYIEKAEVYLEPSGQILARISEQLPLYRVVGDSIDYYNSRNASRMPLKKGINVNVPFVSGDIDSLSHIEVVRVLDAMQEDPFFCDVFMDIDVKRYNKGEGYGYTLTASTRLEGIKVILGDGTFIEEKIENFKALYSYLTRDDKLKEYKVVNLEFVDYLVLQRKK